MQDIEIKLPADADMAAMEKAIEAALATAGLEIALRGSLRKYPGCLHWHARLPGQSGTLEATLWPQRARAWFTIQDGRRAGWIADKLTEVRRRLRAESGKLRNR